MVNLDTGDEISANTTTVDFAGGANNELTQIVDTSTFAPGAYACIQQATVGGITIDLGGAGFDVLEVPLSADVSIATDQASYLPFSSASVSQQITNTSATTIDSLTINSEVLAPDGSTFFAQVSALGSLPAGASADANYLLPLGATMPGTYQFTSEVFGPDSGLLASAATSADVLSSDQTGTGVQATIIATPDPVSTGETLNLSATVANNGNDAVSGRAVTWRIIDLVTQVIVFEAGDTLPNLSLGATAPITVDWLADADPESVLEAQLLADFNGMAVILGTVSFTVAPALLFQDRPAPAVARDRLSRALHPVE